LDGLLEYNPSLAQAQSYNGTARYKPEIGKVLNLGYRYTYVDGLPANDIRQADFSAQWPLFWHWNAVSRLSYSLGNQSVTEELAGLEYNRSCWMLRLVAQKFPIPGQKVSTGVFIQLELRDLVALGSDPLNALRLAVPGYSKLGRPAADEATPGLP
jgi:LPS-assembly protein